MEAWFLANLFGIARDIFFPEILEIKYTKFVDHTAIF